MLTHRCLCRCSCFPQAQQREPSRDGVSAERQGVHPKGVQEMLGHATTSIALDTYSHVLPNMHRDASLALEQVLWG